jgi:hypothetical protein
MRETTTWTMLRTHLTWLHLGLYRRLPPTKFTTGRLPIDMHEMPSNLDARQIIRHLDLDAPIWRGKDSRCPVRPAALAATGPQRYLVTLVDRDAANARAVAARIGPPARITSDRFLDATLEGGQLRAVANLDAVLAVDRWFAPESDMDKARIQSGANFVETAGA